MPQEWNVGDKLANRWEIRKVMKGGMGVVYVVYDHEWQEVQAAKTFQDQVFADDPLLGLLFTQEAQAWVDLAAHPNVARAEFVQEIEGKPVLFLEYVSGGDLSRWIGTPRLLGRESEVVRLALEFCDGMAHLRVRGIEAHRDIKPQNCLLTETGRLKITDFGLAKVAEDLVRGAAGTATHMPPEQFMNAKSVGVAADVYSFGVMLFQMLTGRLPFAGESWDDFEMAHMFQLPPVEQIEHAGLRAVVAKCLDKQAEARYENFVVLRGELEGIYRELTGNAAPAPAAAIPVESDPGHWANKGFSLLALGKVDRAKECFGKALELDRNSAAANVGLGNVWLANGEPGWALDYFKASVEADSEFALGWYSVAVGLEVVKPHPEWDEEALAAVDRALELDPGLAMAWSTKGVVLRAMNLDGRAEDCYRRALELDPRLGAAWSNFGSLWMDRCQYAEAVRCEDKAVELAPENASAWFNRGNALVMAQRLEDGEASYKKAVELDPGMADAWYGLARLLERQKGREADAAEVYGKYLELKPKDGWQWMSLGELRDKLGDKEGAYAAFSKACEYAPGMVKAQHNRGVLANEFGRQEEALAAFEAAWKVTKLEPEIGLARGNVLGALGRVDEALAAYDELLAAHPKFERGWFSKGATLGNAKRFEEALECFAKAGELGHPKAEGAAENCRKALAAAAPPVLTARDWHNKGADLAEAGQADEALVCFDKALELAPGAPETLFGKGVALGQVGRMEEALGCMEKVCEAAPDFWVAWSRRGLALQVLDRPDEAVACYEEAMRRGGSGLEPMIAECRAAAEKKADWKARGMAAAGEGKWEEAVGCFDKALEKTPESVEVLLEKGKALEELGRREEALAAYMAACGADSDNGTAWLRRGMVLQALERWEPAIASYEEAAHLGGTGVSELIRQCRTELDRGVDWLARAATMVEEGKWAEALACYDKGLAMEPGSALFLAEKGLALDELGRYDEALEVLEEACEADPSYWVPWFRRGSVLQMRLGRHDEAIRCYEKAGEAGYAGAAELIAICRRQTPAGLMADWMEKGEALLAEGNAEDAAVAFAAAGDADPTAGQPWLRRGTVLRSPLRRYAEAVEALEKAAALGCGEGTALAAACRTEWKDEVNRLRSKSVEAALGLKTEEALAASDEALRLDPENAEVWLARALVMSKLDRPAERLAALEQAVVLDAGNGFAWMMKAIAEGATPAGLASAEQAERLGNPKGKELAARYRRELGDGPAVPAAPAAPVTFAAPAVAAAAAAAPPPFVDADAPFSGTLPAFQAPVVEDAPFSGTLPAFRAPVADDAPFSGTLPAFQAPVVDAPFSGTLPAFQAPSLAPPPPPPAAPAGPAGPAGPAPEELFAKGMEQLGANGNLTEALLFFEQAVAARPEYCEAWWGKGIVLAQFGQNEAAVEAFDRALTVNPRYGAAWMSKGAIFANLGRFAEALPFYEQAKQLGEPAADFAIAECHRVMGGSWPPAWG